MTVNRSIQSKVSYRFRERGLPPWRAVSFGFLRIAVPTLNVARGELVSCYLEDKKDARE